MIAILIDVEKPAGNGTEGPNPPGHLPPLTPEVIGGALYGELVIAAVVELGASATVGGAVGGAIGGAEGAVGGSEGAVGIGIGEGGTGGGFKQPPWDPRIGRRMMEDGGPNHNFPIMAGEPTIGGGQITIDKPGYRQYETQVATSASA